MIDEEYLWVHFTFLLYYGYFQLGCLSSPYLYMNMHKLTEACYPLGLFQMQCMNKHFLPAL